MIKGFKVKLKPNDKQKQKLMECFGVSRFAYNWALDYQVKNYEQGNRYISEGNLRKIFTRFKQDNRWLYNYSNNITKQAIKDLDSAYQKFFEGNSDFPKFKSKRYSKQSFYVDTDVINFTENKVRLEKLTTSLKRSKQKFNWVKLAEKNRIPLDVKYQNPRVSFDGVDFWISVSVEVSDEKFSEFNDGIGIDLGISKLAHCSNDVSYKNINKTKKVKKIKKKLVRLQRKCSRKYLINKKGEKYCKTNNIIKLEEQINGLYKKLTDIRTNHLHQSTTDIVNGKPKFIVMEDLNVKAMMKNKNVSLSIEEQCWNKFKNMIIYKCDRHGIEFKQVARKYPSSKLCSCCGNHKKELKLSDRVYKCSKCGTVIDRDYNASLNLKSMFNQL